VSGPGDRESVEPGVVAAEDPTGRAERAPADRPVGADEQVVERHGAVEPAGRVQVPERDAPGGERCGALLRSERPRIGQAGGPGVLGPEFVARPGAVVPDEAHDAGAVDRLEHSGLTLQSGSGVAQRSLHHDVAPGPSSALDPFRRARPAVGRVTVLIRLQRQQVVGEGPRRSCSRFVDRRHGRVGSRAAAAEEWPALLGSADSLVGGHVATTASARTR
jgi:hypothetical protein